MECFTVFKKKFFSKVALALLAFSMVFMSCSKSKNDKVLSGIEDVLVNLEKAISDKDVEAVEKYYEEIEKVSADLDFKTLKDKEKARLDKIGNRLEAALSEIE